MTDSGPVPTPTLGQRISAPGYDITFRFQEATNLTDAEEQELIELLRLAFNGGPSWFALVDNPLDHLRWKFQDFPGTAQAELLEEKVELPEQDHRIVGMIYAMRRRFLVQGRELIGRDAVDLALDPALQGRGIQTLRTVDMLPARLQLFPEVAFNWNLAAHPAARHLQERTHTQNVANYLETHLKLLSLRRLVRGGSRTRQDTGTSRTRTMLESRQRRLTRLGERARLGIRLAAGYARSNIRRPQRATTDITTVHHFGDDFDQFGVAAAAAFDLIQVRDAEYLNWRFTDPRGGRFVVRAAHEGDRLLGYVAVRLDRDEAVLADLLTLPDRPDVATALLADAIEVAQQAALPVMRAWLPRHHPYRDALKRSGFIASPAVVSLGYQLWWGDAADMAFLSDPQARVHFMNADSDHR